MHLSYFINLVVSFYNLTVKTMPKFSDFINETITKAGKTLKDGFGSTLKIDKKLNKNDLVTEFDYKSEEIIINNIKKAFPSHSIISEEDGLNDNSSEFKWIIDPLDGTVNFANNIPIFSVSIALTKDNEIIQGAVYNPIIDELFFAEKDNGTTLNNKKITVSDKSDFQTSLLVTGFPYNVNEKPELSLNSFNKIVSRGIPVRRLGSAALDLAYVACGRFEGFWEVNLKSWDVAAGILLVNEAGGICTNYDSKKSEVNDGNIVATNNKIHKELLDIINEN
jgi:myo-inositol-1(or 4)-monophosphatase